MPNNQQPTTTSSHTFKQKTLFETMHCYVSKTSLSFSSQLPFNRNNFSTGMYSGGEIGKFSGIDNDSSEESTVNQTSTNEAIDIAINVARVKNSATDSDDGAKQRMDIFESTFPHKLYHILQSPEFKDIITWMPNGKSWRMIDRKEFSLRVLPLFFRHQKYSSFKRQLSGWEFVRGVEESVADQYHHPVRRHCHVCVSIVFYSYSFNDLWCIC